MKNNYLSLVWIGLMLAILFPVAAFAETYAYDAAGRLTGVTYADGSVIAYTYDANGNILNRVVGTSATVALTLNAATFNTASSMTLTATTVAGSPPTVADIYVAEKLADGTFLIMQPNGSFSTAITPLLSNVTVPNFNGPILTVTFTGAEPVGNYTWFAAFMQPGTLNVLGALAAAPFTFAP